MIGKIAEDCRNMIDGNDAKGPGAVYVIFNLVKFANHIRENRENDIENRDDVIKSK